MTNQVSVSQQMYVNKGQFIIGKQPEKLLCEPPKYCIHFILPMLIGILLCGVPLASMVTLYLRSQCCTSTSTTAVSTQTPGSQTNSSVALQEAYYCAGVSSYTLWQLFASAGITMSIDTSNCSFNSTPLYFTSMAGVTVHWDLAGYTAIYYPTKNSFRVYARSLSGVNNTQLLSEAQMYAWNVNWFAISN